MTILKLFKTTSPFFVKLSVYVVKCKEAANKILFLVDGPLRGEGGLIGCATKEKRTFLM